VADGEDQLLGPSGSSFANADAVNTGDQDRRGDLRFAVGVALALILPGFLGFGFYEAIHSIILMANRISHIS
jgi:hypothetical protein